MKPLLNVSSLKVNYGGVYAVKKISIQVYEGQIVSITGANGAGKSSTLNALTGIYAPSSGEIVFRGENITGFNAHRIVKRGLVQVPEGRHLFPNLTVRENLLTGNHCIGGLMLGKDISRDEFLKKFPSAKQVPQIIINNKHIGNFEDTEKWLAFNEINEDF